MSDRITDSMLENRVKRINELTNSPLTPYSKIDGKNVANVGNFHLSHSYGGVCLHRMCNESGGVRTPIISYHTTKRHLYDLMNAWIDGIEFAREEMTETA
jgi:hypothetical protein